MYLFFITTELENQTPSTFNIHIDAITKSIKITQKKPHLITIESFQVMHV